MCALKEDPEEGAILANSLAWLQGDADSQRTVAYLDVLCIDVSVGVQQQADDGGVAGQHGPVQRRVLVIFVTQVDRHVEGE